MFTLSVVLKYELVLLNIICTLRNICFFVLNVRVDVRAPGLVLLRQPQFQSAGYLLLLLSCTPALHSD